MTKTCPWCRMENPDYARFCSRCGGGLPAETPAPGPEPQAPGSEFYGWPGYPGGFYPPYQKDRSSAALILGTLSLIFWLLPILGIPVSIVGIVLSSDARRGPRPELGRTALVLSTVGLGLAALNSIGGVLLALMNLNL